MHRKTHSLCLVMGFLKTIETNNLRETGQCNLTYSIHDVSSLQHQVQNGMKLLAAHQFYINGIYKLEWIIQRSYC